MKAPVGYFKDPASSAEVLVTQRDGESPDDAIARVAADHKIGPEAVTRGEPPAKKLNPVTGLAERLLQAASAGDGPGALTLAETIAAELRRELNISTPGTQTDDDRDYTRGKAVSENFQKRFSRQTAPGEAKPALVALPNYESVV
jgi:hypothetical protein